AGETNTVYGDKIAHIDLEGVISSSIDAGWGGTGASMVERLGKDLKRAREDDDVKAIVLRVNSPGGEVTASDVLYNHVKKAAAKKPVVIYMDSVAASGGYYAACGGTEIMANHTTMTGSIGVIISTLNYQSLFDKLGVDSVVFTSGEFKDTMSGTRPMREDERKMVQGMVDQIYERFLTVVKDARTDIPEEELRANIANGRIFTGQEALDNKLIDNIGYIEDAYDRARELGGVPDAKVVKYNQEVTIFDALGLMQSRLAQGNSTKVEISLPDQVLPRLQPGMMYLLPTFYSH
ncbi:MAG: signal peptide peptidase SppA, partial [Verrucomicrobiota bacterium]